MAKSTRATDLHYRSSPRTGTAFKVESRTKLQVFRISMPIPSPLSFGSAARFDMTSTLRASGIVRRTISAVLASARTKTESRSISCRAGFLRRQSLRRDRISEGRALCRRSESKRVRRAFHSFLDYPRNRFHSLNRTFHSPIFSWLPVSTKSLSAAEIDVIAAVNATPG